MSVELWLGHEYEHTHEMKSLGQFLSRMEALYGRDDDFYFIFANFFCQSEEIDLAVFKRNGIVIVEFKEADDPVLGQENGPWVATKQDGSQWQINPGRTRNPFEQTRTYRYAMIDQLKQDAQRFLPKQRILQMRLDHVDAVVALCPTKHPNTRIQIRQIWFSVVGLDELPQEIGNRRSPQLNFSKSELQKLAEQWGLCQQSLGRFVPGLAVEPPTSDKLVQAPAISVQTRTVATSCTVKAPALPQPDAEEQCVVCRYTQQACQVPTLRGEIRDVIVESSSRSSTGQLKILQNDKIITLTLHELWGDILPSASKILRQLRSTGEDRQLTIVAYHMEQQADGTLVVGPDSLLILEPDWLINVTDLTKVEYCPREYLIGHFRPISPNIHLIRGNIVHRVFGQMVKTPLDEQAIAKSLERAFIEQVMDLALAGLTKQMAQDEIKIHYDRLEKWIRIEQPPQRVRNETFLLAPQVGMKGKIDVLWSDNELLHVGELKTGQSYRDNPRPGHAFQVGAYSLMAMVRGWSASVPSAMVLYSGNRDTPDPQNIKRHVLPAPDTPEKFREIVRHRNRLVLSDYLTDAPFETIQPNKCKKCQNSKDCEAMAVLLSHDDPRPAELRNRFDLHKEYEKEEQIWFKAYADLLAKEYRAVKISHAAMWRMSPEERCNQGTALKITGVSDMSASGDLSQHTYFFKADNQSELREEDYVLVSDADGPTRGQIAQGVVKHSSENGLEIEFSRRLEFEPRFVDRYVSEELVERQFSGVYLWLHQPLEYRNLVIHNRAPRFIETQIQLHYPSDLGNHRLNKQQQQAVQMALQMEDYLLIQGPPGSGKTDLVAAIVRELIHQNKRVLLAAGTNTAVDNMIKSLIEFLDADLRDRILRLGAKNRVDQAYQKYIPGILARHDDLDTYIQQLRSILQTRSIVAATATTWLSGKWDDLPKFDVAIIDEAAQLTLPATLGPLRLARQFILIGDPRQLPPVVLSESKKAEFNSQPRLSQSLFEHLYAHLDKVSPKSIVKLNEQYRMNKEICAIPCQMKWYDDLRPGTDEISNGKLRLRQIPREHRLFAVLDPQQPVVFADVPRESSARGPRNEREAELIRDLLQVYLEHGLNIDSIGIIAPFRAQVATIRRTLEIAFPEHKKPIRGMVDTVDRFQGRERDLVILSLATHGNSVHELLQDARRLNVALTRAKHKLIILGDVSALSTHPMYDSLIQHCTVIQSAQH